jgi:phosphate transport system permease protein
MKRLNFIVRGLVLGFSAVWLSACAASTSAETVATQVTLENKGSDTMVNLALAWAEAYQAQVPDVRLSVTGGGSGTGLAALINGTVDIANASRAIINLAGIPSVVYGLFGLGLFVLFLQFGTSIVAGCLTLSIMPLPVIISTAEEALRAVPQSFRVVSMSLGGTKWQTIRRIVLPQALPGILTGVILGLNRAAGETAPILFTAATFFLPRLPDSVFDATMALPYHLFVISTQVPGMPIQIQYGTALVLLTFVLSMNIIATVIRSRARAQRQW